MAGTGAPSIQRRVITVAWPFIIESLFATVMFYADMLMLGRLPRSEAREAIAVMGVSGPIVFTLMMILGAWRVGIIATVSRAVGEKDPEKQQRAAATGLWITMGIGAVGSVLGFFVIPHMVGIYHVPGNPNVVKLAFEYTQIFGSIVFFFMTMTGATAIMRAAGNTRVPMVIGSLAHILNITLNYALIYGHWGFPKMEVVGAAYATATAQAFYGVASFLVLFTPFSEIRLRPAAFRLVSRASFDSLMRVGVPALMEPVVLQTGFLVYSVIVARLGELQLAAHRVGIAIESLTFMPGMAIATACSALVGQSLGAKKPHEAEQVFHASSRLAMYFMSAVGILILLTAMPLVGLFAPEEKEMQPVGALLVAIICFSEPFFATAMILAGVLRGAGETRSPVVVAFIGTWMIRIPLSWFMAYPMDLGIYGVWITMNVDWFVRMWVLLWLYKRGKWREVKL